MVTLLVADIHSGSLLAPVLDVVHRDTQAKRSYKNLSFYISFAVVLCLDFLLCSMDITTLLAYLFVLCIKYGCTTRKPRLPLSFPCRSLSQP